jgi:hypothetical protein
VTPNDPSRKLAIGRASREPPIAASLWGWLAFGLTALSMVGYLLQIALDHVPGQPIVDDLVFFGLFEWDGLLGLAVGLVAVITGRRRKDATVKLGFVAIAWVVVAQTIQSLWD